MRRGIVIYLFIYFWHPNSRSLKPQKWPIISLLPMEPPISMTPQAAPHRCFIRLTDFWKKVPKPRLTLHKGLKQRFDSNQAFLFMQKLRSTAWALHQESRMKSKKSFQFAPKLLMNAELYGLLLAPRVKKDPPSPCIEDEPNSRPLSPHDWPHSLLQLGLSRPPITLT